MTNPSTKLSLPQGAQKRKNRKSKANRKRNVGWPVYEAFPEHLKPEFYAYMEAHDLDDLPDGAWFAVLEEAAERFIQQHALHCCNNDAAIMYLDHLSEPQAPTTPSTDAPPRQDEIALQAVVKISFRTPKLPIPKTDA